MYDNINELYAVQGEIAYSFKLNKLVDSIDSSFSDIQTKIDGFGEISEEEIKKYVIGANVVNGRYSCEYSRSSIGSWLWDTFRKPVDEQGSEVTGDHISMLDCYSLLGELVNKVSGVVQYPHSIFSPNDAGYSLYAHKKYADMLYNSDRGVHPRRWDGLVTGAYSILAYDREISSMISSEDGVHRASGQDEVNELSMVQMRDSIISGSPPYVGETIIHDVCSSSDSESNVGYTTSTNESCSVTDSFSSSGSSGSVGVTYVEDACTTSDSIHLVVSGTPVVHSVSGTVSDGVAITIGGFNFGLKSPARPLIWDTFQTGVNGLQVKDSAVYGIWDTGAGCENVKYSTDMSYSGTKSCKLEFRDGQWNASLCKNGQFDKLYIDFKQYYQQSTGMPSNFKPFRLYGDSDSMQLYKGYGCSYQVVTAEHGTLNKTYWGGQGLAGKLNNWLHYQLMFKESSPNTNDGTIICLRNCTVDAANGTSEITRTNNEHFSQIRIGHYFDVTERDGCNPSDTADLYVDNVYIDTTFSRVEIGDSSTYGGCTRREIQIPTAWTDSSVSVSVNLGKFNTGDVAFLFVINSNNESSVGFPVTIS